MPVTREEAVQLLNQALNKNGYSASVQGRSLIVSSKDEAKKKSDLDQARAEGRVMERFMAAIAYDTEQAPRTTNRAQLLELGIVVPAVDAIPAADDEAPRRPPPLPLLPPPPPSGPLRLQVGPEPPRPRGAAARLLAVATRPTPTARPRRQAAAGGARYAAFVLGQFGTGGAVVDWTQHIAHEFTRVSLWGHDFSVGNQNRE